MRGRGHIADVADERDWPISNLVGDVHVPAMVDLSKHVDHVRDQGATSSCVAQAFARAVHVRAGVEGIAIPFPSALEIYALARREDLPLVDQGSRPRAAASAMRELGVTAEARWPFDEGKVNDLPSWDVLQHSVDALVTGYYRIGGDGDERCRLVRQALAAGYPVPFALQVDQAFENYGNGILDRFSGANLGGHMTALIGYGPGWFLGINSWGTGWGDGGFFRTSDARIGEPTCTDFYALTVAPKRVS